MRYKTYEHEYLYVNSIRVTPWRLAVSSGLRCLAATARHLKKKETLSLMYNVTERSRGKSKSGMALSGKKKRIRGKTKRISMENQP
jgi:hypothetical protein